MAEKLGQALLDLDTNDKGLKKGVGEAEKSATKLGRVFDDTARRAAAMGKTLGIAAGVGAVALGVLVKRAIDSADAMSKSAVRAGVTTEELSRLAWAGELSDVSLGSLTMSLGRLSNLMAQVASGGAKDTAAIFKALGIEVTDADGKLRSTAEVMPEIADAIAGMESGTERTALAMQFFGRSGAELLPMLVNGSAGLRGMADEADRLGKTISTQTGRDAEEFNDTLTRIGAVIDGVTLKVAAGALPQLQELASSFADPKFGEAATLFGQVVIGVLNAIIQGASNAANNIRMIKDALGAVDDMSTAGLEGRLRDLGLQKLKLDNVIVASQSKLAKGDTLFGINQGALEAQITESRKQIEALIDQESHILDLLAQREAAQTDGSTGTVSTPDLVDLPDLSGLFDGLGGSAAAASDPVKDLLASLRGEMDILRELDPVQQRMIALRETLKTATGSQRAEVEGLITSIEAEQAAWTNAQELAQFFGDLTLSSIEGLIDGSKSLTDVLGDVIDAMAQAVLQSMLLGQGPLAGSFGTLGANGGVGGIFGALAGIFAGGFYTGGLIPNGTFGIVGERGPEPVIGTSRGAMVLPNSSLSSGMGSGGDRPINVNIDGSGLSQSELTQAIADGIAHYDRYQLPSRVAQIQSDPLARG